MTVFAWPWIELSIVLPLAGAGCVDRLRDSNNAYRWSIVFSGLTFACALMAALGFYFQLTPPIGERWTLGFSGLDRAFPVVDELSAPMIPAVALLHLLTFVASARTKMRRVSFAWMLVGASIGLATFSCKEPRILVSLLVLGTLPPFGELISRGKSIRVFALHMALFAGLLGLGWYLVETGGGRSSRTSWGMVALLAAILLRGGAVPVHCWVTDLFERLSFAGALMFVAPITGVYATFRLVLPYAPDWVLQSIGLVSLTTAVYAAAMAVVQREARRFFSYLFLSNASLVLIGLELHNTFSLTGALGLWFSVTLSLGGFGLSIRALESRFRRLTLADYHGLYDQSPALALCFLLTGLASVGFPGTLGFVSTELLVDGAIEANPWVGLAVVLATALNGIAVVRAYFLLFTGTRHSATVSLEITTRERFAVLTLAALILGGGLYPQPGVTTRHHAAEAILRDRAVNTGVPFAPAGEGEAEDHPH